MCDAARQYEFLTEKRRNDEEQAAEELTLQTDEWKLEFEQTMDSLSIDTKYGDATYKKAIRDLELIFNAVKEYYRED